MKCDVIDDIDQEAREVYVHNPWLVYGAPLHRIRELGLKGPVYKDFLDKLDEEFIPRSEVQRFITEMYVK